MQVEARPPHAAALGLQRVEHERVAPAAQAAIGGVVDVHVDLDAPHPLGHGGAHAGGQRILEAPHLPRGEGVGAVAVVGKVLDGRRIVAVIAVVAS